MTFSMQQIAMKLLSGSIPVEWSRDWINAPESVQAWLKELVRKRIGLTRLCSLVEKKKLLSEPINLNDFFSPCTFISALRQLTARSTGCPMDQLKLICRWEKDTLSLRKCSHTCIITGLWLQGADIHPSTGCLTEPKQGAADLVLVHTVTIGFVPITTSTVIDSSSELTSVPVFLSPSREESLMELSMKIEPSSKNDMKLGQISADTQWVLAGTALFLRSEE